MGGRSSIVTGDVYHCRMTPRRHEFSYPIFTMQLDLDQLESRTDNSLLFGYEKWRLLSIWRGDYLRDPAIAKEPCVPGRSYSLREKVEGELARQGGDQIPTRITLVTMPRIGGYVFNPVSFFLCFNHQDQLIACITEVHNTFGEAHIYPLVCEPNDLPVEWRFPKGFFVSPFFDVEGEYRVAVEQEGKELRVAVDLYKSGSLVFASSLSGSAKGLSTANILRTLISFPLALLLTMPRIHFQALLLFFKERITPYTKPAPISSYTIYSQQNIIHRARLWLLSVLQRARF
jgi:DUF1365 family protein